MMWIFAILVVLAMGGIAAPRGRPGDADGEAYDDRPDALVPADGDLVGDDLRRVRFSLAFRGYRMSEVDALLERLAAQVAACRRRSSRELPPRPTPAEPEPAGRAATPERGRPSPRPASAPGRRRRPAGGPWRGPRPTRADCLPCPSR